MASANPEFRPPGGDPWPGVAGTDPTAPADAGTPIYDDLIAAISTTRTDADALADRRSPGADPAIKPAADTVEGTAILALFSRLKDIEEGDGGWPGSDVVDAVCGWFAELGIDVDSDPAAAARALCGYLSSRSPHSRSAATSPYPSALGESQRMWTCARGCPLSRPPWAQVAAPWCSTPPASRSRNGTHPDTGLDQS